MVADLLPGPLAEADVDQQDPVWADDADQLREDIAPGRDQVEHVTRERRAESVVDERQPRRVPDDQGEGRVPFRLLDQLPEHRSRQIDADHPDPRPMQRESDQARPDPDLEARLSSL